MSRPTPEQILEQVTPKAGLRPEQVAVVLQALKDAFEAGHNHALDQVLAVVEKETGQDRDDWVQQDPVTREWWDPPTLEALGYAFQRHAHLACFELEMALREALGITLERENPNATIGRYLRQPYAWLASGDTGESSKTIWSVMTGFRIRGHYLGMAPADDADFGRCYRLLRCFPEWMPRLPELAERFPESWNWGPLVPVWSELTRLWEAGDSRGVYALMRKARGEEPPVEGSADVGPTEKDSTS